MSSSYRRQALIRILTGLVLTAVAALLASGCKPSGGEGYYSGPWYNVFGESCATSMPGPGCDYHANGMKLFIYEDPFFGNSPQAICGFGYDPNTCLAADTGYFWYSPDGIIYDPYGNAMNSAEEQGSRDIIANSAAASEKKVLEVGHEFAQKNALTEATGIRIARTLNQMATLPKRLGRARTDSDIADFTQRLYGVEMGRVLSAAASYSTGDDSSLRELNAEVARNWGTNPETAETILKNWYSNAR